MFVLHSSSGRFPPKLDPGNITKSVGTRTSLKVNSAELQGPRQLLRIRPEIFDFEPDLGRQLVQTKPKISGTIPTNRRSTIPNDSGPISACFDDDPKLSNCEIAQPNQLGRKIKAVCWHQQGYTYDIEHGSRPPCLPGEHPVCLMLAALSVASEPHLVPAKKLWHQKQTTLLRQ